MMKEKKRKEIVVSSLTLISQKLRGNSQKTINNKNTEIINKIDNNN